MADAVRTANPDAVLHLAAQSSVPDSFNDPRTTYEVNFLGTLNLLNALSAQEFRGTFVFVGSADVYGLVPEERLPIVEEMPLRPRNPYAVSKVAAEALCYQWSQTTAMRIVIVRPFNHIGPGQSDKFAISSFARQLIEIEFGRRPPVIEAGDVDVTRDFTDVQDVVRAYQMALLHAPNGQILNVCSGIERSPRSLLELMMSLIGVGAQIQQIPSRTRASEQRRSRGSYARLEQLLGWRPKIAIEDSLRLVLAYWRDRLRHD